MGFFNKKTTINDLVMSTGRILLEKTENSTIHKVLKVAPNTNYEGLRVKIEVGDMVVTSEYLYANTVKLDEKEYYVVKAKQIFGIFKKK